MTEERMICELRKIETEDGWGNHNEWGSVEPAPPKDWLPKCWGNLPYCGYASMPVPDAVLFKSCQNCTFRKKE